MCRKPEWSIPRFCIALNKKVTDVQTNAWHQWNNPTSVHRTNLFVKLHTFLSARIHSVDSTTEDVTLHVIWITFLQCWHHENCADWEDC